MRHRRSKRPNGASAWIDAQRFGKRCTYPKTPHRLANIERPTGWNRVDRPRLIYTAGGRGSRNTDLLANRVYWIGPAGR